MGCDIHAHAEKQVDGRWEKLPIDVFDCRSYGLFGFLADIRNYSAVPPIAEPRGFPTDASAGTVEDYEDWGADAHTPSWLTLAELLAFDYDRKMEDRRVTRQVGPNAWDGGCTAQPGEGEGTTYRKFLGEWFFKELDRYKEAGAERLVFWFDN